jgi:hypothetical protein
LLVLVQIFRSCFYQGLAGRSRRVALGNAVVILWASILFPAGALATPAEEISQAVAVQGVADLSKAQPRQFLKAFTAVALRIQARELPPYVIAAINLRPDLAPNIVAVAVKAAVKNSEDKPNTLCGIIERIVKAAIIANPDAVLAVVRAAVSSAPPLRHCVANGAISAAPQSKDAILRAAMAKAVPFAFLTFSASHESGFSYAAPTLNPGNISDLGDDEVNSPEQPPAP